MAMVPVPSPPTIRSLALVDANDQAGPGEADIAADAQAGQPLRACSAETIEAQRERAQREFKRIWNLCALPH